MLNLKFRFSAKENIKGIVGGHGIWAGSCRTMLVGFGKHLVFQRKGESIQVFGWMRQCEHMRLSGKAQGVQDGE